MCVREKGRLCDPWHTHTHTWTNGRFEIEDNRARERAMTLGKHAVWCVQLRRTKKRDRDCLSTLCAFPCGRFHWYMGKQDECVRNSFFFFFCWTCHVLTQSLLLVKLEDAFSTHKSCNYTCWYNFFKIPATMLTEPKRSAYAVRLNFCAPCVGREWKGSEQK